MEITEVKVFPIQEEKLKAFVSIVFDQCFMVNDIKIIQGRDGLFISMPSRKKKNGEFKDVAHPLNNETRRMIEEKVLAEYEHVLGERGESLPAPSAHAVLAAAATTGSSTANTANTGMAAHDGLASPSAPSSGGGVSPAVFAPTPQAPPAGAMAFGAPAGMASMPAMPAMASMPGMAAVPATPTPMTSTPTLAQQPMTAMPTTLAASAAPSPSPSLSVLQAPPSSPSLSFEAAPAVAGFASAVPAATGATGADAALPTPSTDAVAPVAAQPAGEKTLEEIEELHLRDSFWTVT